MRDVVLVGYPDNDDDAVNEPQIVKELIDAP